MDDVAALRGEAGVQERGHRDEHLGTYGCNLWYIHGVAASGRNGCSLEYTYMHMHMHMHMHMCMHMHMHMCMCMHMSCVLKAATVPT